MATLIQTAEESGNSASSVITTGGAVVAGNLLFVACLLEGSIFTATVADDRGNVYTPHSVFSPRTFTSYVHYVWYVKSAAAGVTTVTITISGTVTHESVLGEYSGLDTSSPEDGSNSNEDLSGTATVWTPGPVTTSAGGIVIGCVQESAIAPTAASGFTRRRFPAFGFFYAYEDETTPHTAPGTFTPSWTGTAQSYRAIGLAFKDLVVSTTSEAGAREYATQGRRGGARGTEPQIVTSGGGRAF